MATPEEMAQLAKRIKADDTSAIEALASRWADFISDSPTTLRWGRHAALKATFLAGAMTYSCLINGDSTKAEFWQAFFDSWQKGKDLPIEHKG